MLCATTCCLLAQGAIAPNEWHFRQTTDVSSVGLVRISLPLETLHSARPALDDLRLLDATGAEVPYIIEGSAAEPEAKRPPKEFHASIEGAATRINIETGSEAALRGLTLEAPGTGEFIKPARVEGSRDGQRWELLVDHEPVFRQAGGATNLHITLPDGSWPFLRVTVDDSRSPPIAWTGAQLHTAAVNLPTEPLMLTIESRDETSGVTRIALGMGAMNLTPSTLHLETTDSLFTRPVTVAIAQVSGDKVLEQPLVHSIIFRVDLDGKTEARLDVPIDLQVKARELILFIQYVDSPPLSIGAIRGERRAVYLTFPARTPGHYLLLSGNSQCAAPRYDLAGLSGDLKTARTTSARLSALVTNPDYQAADQLATVSFAGVKIDVHSWGYRKSLNVSKPGTAEVELDADVLVHGAKDFSDLRLVREDRQIPFLIEKTSISRSLPIPQTSSNDPKKPTLSRWSLKLPRAGLPITRIVGTLGPGVFERELRLSEMSPDERGENYPIDLGSLRVVQTPKGKAREIVFEISRPPVSDSLIVETDNGDNAAIDLHDFHAEYRVSRLIFKANTESSAPLWVYYGNREASAPRYDVALVANELLHSERMTATTGPEEVLKPTATSSDTLTGASRYIFWGVLGLVVVGLLVLVARFVPKVD